MRKKYVNLLILASALFCRCTSVIAQSQDDQKAYMDYMTPGSMHKMIAKSVGNWSGVVTYWIQPGAPPSMSTTEASSQMIMGGRYLQTKYNGTMMGMPFEGMGMIGYDNAKKMFISTWVDIFRTGVLYMEGTWDDQRRSINFTGKVTDPVTGKDQPFRKVFKFIDDNTQEEETYSTSNGQEFKTVHVKYTRK